MSASTAAAVQTAAVSTAIAIASTGASMIAQQVQASQQAAYNRAAAEQRNREIAENYQLAIASMNQQQKALQERQRQEGEAASEEEQRTAIEAAKARATARVAAGEAGVAGLSVDALLNDFFRQEGVYRSSVRRNLDYTRSQLSSEMEGVRAQAQGRANSIRPFTPEPVTRPSFLGAALRIGADAGGSFLRTYKKP